MVTTHCFKNISADDNRLLSSIPTGFPPVIPPPTQLNGDIFVAGSDICIPLNGNARLDCTVESGSPVVEYRWTRNFSPEIDITRIITVDMAGSYTCDATNDFGDDDATSIVIGVSPSQLALSI